jgi:hypothetical protein
MFAIIFLMSFFSQADTCKNAHVYFVSNSSESVFLNDLRLKGEACPAPRIIISSNKETQQIEQNLGDFQQIMSKFGSNITPERQKSEFDKLNAKNAKVSSFNYQVTLQNGVLCVSNRLYPDGSLGNIFSGSSGSDLLCLPKGNHTIVSDGKTVGIINISNDNKTINITEVEPNGNMTTKKPYHQFRLEGEVIQHLYKGNVRSVLAMSEYNPNSCPARPTPSIGNPTRIELPSLSSGPSVDLYEFKYANGKECVEKVKAKIETQPSPGRRENRGTDIPNAPLMIN